MVETAAPTRARPTAAPRLGRWQQRRFAALLPPGLAPEDALLWLEHPERDGPSGAPGPAARLATARRELYRRSPGARAAREVEELARRLEAERAVVVEALDASRGRSPGRLSVVAVAAALVLAVGVGVLTTTVGDTAPRRPASPPPGLDPSIAARTLRVTAAERDRILALFSSSTDGDRVLRNRVQSAIDQTADGPYPADGARIETVPRLVGGRAAGRRVAELDGSAGGAVTVAVVLGRAASWRVRVVTDGTPDPVAHGTAAGGRLQYALLLVPASARATGVVLDVSDGVPYAWQAVHRSD